MNSPPFDQDRVLFIDVFCFSEEAGCCVNRNLNEQRVLNAKWHVEFVIGAAEVGIAIKRSFKSRQEFDNCPEHSEISTSPLGTIYNLQICKSCAFKVVEAIGRLFNNPIGPENL